MNLFRYTRRLFHVESSLEGPAPGSAEPQLGSTTLRVAWLARALSYRGQGSKGARAVFSGRAGARRSRGKGYSVFFLLAILGLGLLFTPTLLTAAEAPPEPPSAPQVGAEPSPPSRPERPRGSPRHRNERDIFMVRDSVRVAAHEAVGGVLAVLADVQVDGTVDDGVLAIGGNIVANGVIEDGMLAVLGNVEVRAPARGDVMAVLGNVVISSPVSGSVVAVMGSVILEEGADVRGDVLAIGGQVQRHAEAQTRRNVQQIGFLPGTPEFAGLRAWFKQAFLLGRPLASGEHLGWAWAVAGGFLAFYLFIALVFGRGLIQCAETLEQRPGRTLLAGLVTVLLTPLLMILLVVTAIGPVLLLFALILASLIGKAAFLTWLGRRGTLPMGFESAFSAVLLGGVVLAGLYLVPVLGLILWSLTGACGLGMVVYTLMLEVRTPPPPRVAAGTPATSGLAPAAVSAPPAAGFPSTAVAAPSSLAEATAGQEVPGDGPPPLPLREPPPLLSTLPRAGFGIRLLASLLDFILISLIAVAPFGGGSLVPLLLATYCVVLWKLKGTTIGGIIFGLRVVRLDDRPLDWSIALVRALGAFLSLAVAGLGFIWVIFDEEKQSWHDKIAGTTVVHMPKGQSLI